MGYFTGKIIIITGAGFATLKDGSAGSIGFGIATAFAKEGANLAITGRNVKKLEAAKERLESEFGIRVLPIQADVNAHLVDEHRAGLARGDVVRDQPGATIGGHETLHAARGSLAAVLRAELARVKMERDILGKATAYFAKAST